MSFQTSVIFLPKKDQDHHGLDKAAEHIHLCLPLAKPPRKRLQKNEKRDELMQTWRMREEEATAAGQSWPYIFASTKADGHTN